MSVLAKSLAGFVHRPQVHYAITVAQEIDSVIPPHGVLAGAFIVGGQRNRLASRGKAPQVLGGAALVALGGAPLCRLPRKEQSAPARVIASLSRLAERDELDPVIPVDGRQLGVGQGRVAAGGIHYLSIRSPTDHRCATSVKRAPHRQTALSAHRIDLSRTFITR